MITGCPKKQTGTISEGIPSTSEYDRQLPPGQLALRKLTDPNDIPDFTVACSNLASLRQAVKNSLDYMNKPSSRHFFPYGEISHDQAVASLKAFAALLDSNPSPQQMNAAIRQQFDVYTSVGWNNAGSVHYTGYYTPIFDGSMTRTDRFKYPLYKKPASLEKGPDGQTLGMKGPDGSLTRCKSRRDLEQSGDLAGTELAYLADPFEAYVAQVQGSARLRMSDGKMVTVGYTADNGYEYNSVGKELIKDGKIAKESLSLRTLMDYFKAHPDEVNEYTWRNPRYVFFAVTDSAPHGCLNVPVTAYRTIATDKSIFPRASVAFISTKLPYPTGDMRLYQGFAMDQDAGGAIRAAGRCDVYMGIGDQAGELAGRTQQEGRLYYLFLKPNAVPAAVAPVPPATPTAIGQ
ncbi:MAG: MltA domain-containing protein [Phycisphaerae bacterium]